MGKNLLLKIILTIFASIIILLVMFYSLMIKNKEVDLLLRMQNLQKEKITVVSKNNILPEKNVINWSRNIYIHGDINKSTATEIIRSFKNLESKDHNKSINLYINSESGTIDDVFAIIGVMDILTCKVNTIAMGNCLGAGTLILCSGTGDRKASKNAIISIYMPARAKIEKSEDIKLEKERILYLWKNKTKIPSDWFNLLEIKYYYLSPNEAKKYNIIDNVL